MVDPRRRADRPRRGRAVRVRRRSSRGRGEGQGRRRSPRASSWARRRPRAPRRTARIVGRDADLDQLELVARRTFDERRPFLVSVVAPAGVGKSRLLEEFLDRLDPDGPGRDRPVPAVRPAPDLLADARDPALDRRPRRTTRRRRTSGPRSAPGCARPDEPDAGADRRAARRDDRRVRGRGRPDRAVRGVAPVRRARRGAGAARARHRGPALVERQPARPRRVDAPAAGRRAARHDRPRPARSSSTGGRAGAAAGATRSRSPSSRCRRGPSPRSSRTCSSTRRPRSSMPSSRGPRATRSTPARSSARWSIGSAPCPDPAAVAGAIAALPDTVQATVLARLDALEPDARRVVQLGAVLGRYVRAAGDPRARADLDRRRRRCGDRGPARPRPRSGRPAAAR